MAERDPRKAHLIPQRVLRLGHRLPIPSPHLKLPAEDMDNRFLDYHQYSAIVREYNEKHTLNIMLCKSGPVKIACFL